MTRATRFLERKLKLKVNEAKSAVDRLLNQSSWASHSSAL